MALYKCMYYYYSRIPVILEPHNSPGTISTQGKFNLQKFKSGRQKHSLKKSHENKVLGQHTNL